MPPDSSSQFQPAIQDASRSKKLQLLGILSGFAAGAWLGAAEAPTKLVFHWHFADGHFAHHGHWRFLARWSLAALILGTSSVRADVDARLTWSFGRCSPDVLGRGQHAHNFRIRDIGLSIAFLCELEQPSRHSLGISVLQRAPPGRLAPSSRCFGPARLLCVSAPRSLASPPRQGKANRTFSTRGLGRPRCRNSLGTMYIPIAKLTDRDESTFLRDFFSSGEWA